VPVTGGALGENVAIRDIEAREQGRGAMPDMVVRDAFEISKTKRQHGLRTFQRLDLRFLINAQDNRVVRRIEVEPDDVLDLVDEQRIG